VPDRSTSTEQVRVVRLDGIWDQLPPARSHTFLKGDAQDHDLEAIRGAEQALRHDVAIQVEKSGAPLYEDVPSIHGIFAHLHERSFDVTGLFPAARDPANGVQDVDFDACSSGDRSIYDRPGTSSGDAALCPSGVTASPR
jgi:hypothetical protein